MGVGSRQDYLQRRGGCPLKVYGTTMDIDESKKALHELEATKDALACEVGALNRAENALQQSEQHALKLVEELKRADKIKDEFLSILSHELRNPLAAIVTGLSLMDLTTSLRSDAADAGYSKAAVENSSQGWWMICLT